MGNLSKNSEDSTSKLGSDNDKLETNSKHSGDGDQREFNCKIRVITNESKIISEMFHNCTLNK